VSPGCCARATSGHAARRSAEKRNELTSPHIRSIFDRDEVSSKSRHVGCAPESRSKIRVLASVMTDPGGLMMPPGA